MNKFRIYQQMAMAIRWMHLSHAQRRVQMNILFGMIDRDYGNGNHVIADALKAILTFASAQSVEGVTHSEVKACLRLFEQTCAYWIEQAPKWLPSQIATVEKSAASDNGDIPF